MKNINISESKKGFTLIELLVVIAIVAVLAVVLVITLNPAQMLAQARDSTRISDLNSVKSALGLYLADVSSPSLGTNGTCYYASSTVSAGFSNTCGGRYTNTNATSQTATRSTNGTSGWIPVNLASISSGAPLASWPIDPVNNATYWYSYAATSTSQTFELDAKMESTRYANGGSSDVESTDGGSSSSVFEVGTYTGLSL